MSADSPENSPPRRRAKRKARPLPEVDTLNIPLLNGLPELLRDNSMRTGLDSGEVASLLLERQLEQPIKTPGATSHLQNNVWKPSSQQQRLSLRISKKAYQNLKSLVGEDAREMGFAAAEILTALSPTAAQSHLAPITTALKVVYARRKESVRNNDREISERIAEAAEFSGGNLA